VNGPSCGTSRTGAADERAARRDDEPQAPRLDRDRPANERGSAEPSVNAPTRMPIASPRPSRYHPATDLHAGGYARERRAGTSAARPRSGQARGHGKGRETGEARATPRPAGGADQRSESVRSADERPRDEASCTEIVKATPRPRYRGARGRESAGVTAGRGKPRSMAASCDAASTASPGVRSQTGRVVEKRPREWNRTWRCSASALHPRSRCVVPRVKDVQLQLFGRRKMCGGDFARDEVSRPAAAAARIEPAAPVTTPTRLTRPAERHQARRATGEGGELALEGVARNVDLSHGRSARRIPRQIRRQETPSCRAEQPHCCRPRDGRSSGNGHCKVRFSLR